MNYYGLEWKSLDSYFQMKEQSSVGTPPANELRLYAKDSSGVTKLFYKGDDGVEVGPLAANTITGSGAANRLAYWSGASVLAAVAALTQGQIVFPDSNGLPTGDSAFNWDSSNHRLGIGTSSPSTSLHIVTASDNGCILDRYQNNGGAPNGGFDIRGGRGTIASPSAVANNDSIAGFRGYGYGTSFGGTADGALFIKAGEAFSGSAHGTYITLETTPTGSTTRAERFRVGPSGQWGIGGATFGSSGGVFMSQGGSAAPVWSTLILPNAATANRIVYATSSNTWGESANLTFDGTDFLLGSGIRARMASQNRFRYLNSMASAISAAAQTGNTTGTWTTRTFTGTDEFDTDSIHDPASNSSRLTAKLAGKYLVCGTLSFDGASVTSPSNAGARILKNGSTTTPYGTYVPYVGAAVQILVSTAAVISLAVNDYVEIQGVFFGGGGTFDLLDNANVRFQMLYVGE